MRWSVVCVLALACVLPSTLAQEEEAGLTVEIQPEKAVQAGKDATLTCSMNNKTTQWTFENGTKISTLTTGRMYQADGILHIKSAEINDTGNYVCVTTDASFNSTVEFKVYVMPSYFLEGMIIVGINCGLIVLFLVCGVHSLIMAKREKKRREDKEYRLASPI